MIPQIVADGAKISGYSDTLTKNMIAALELNYPAFKGLWRISVNETGGVVEIINLALSGKCGFLMHINKVDPEMRKVVRNAGELLERYRVSREKRASLESVLLLPRNYKGELTADNG